MGLENPASATISQFAFFFINSSNRSLDLLTLAGFTFFLGTSLEVLEVVGPPAILSTDLYLVVIVMFLDSNILGGSS